MASVIYGNGVADIRGSVNGTTFSRNANGAYIRNKTKPFNPNSQAQQEVRQGFGAISRLWKSLTGAQVATWKDQAPNYPYLNRLGQSGIYTPSQLFQKVNSQLTAINEAPVLSMVSPVTLDSISTITITSSIGAPNLLLDISFSTGSGNVPAGCSLVVSCTGIVSDGVSKPSSSSFKQIAVFASGTPIVAKDLWVEYNNKFGTPQVDATTYVQVFLVSTITAQYSNPLSNKLIFNA
jgi:hypothetical protein